jgi:hypothetical protein
VREIIVAVRSAERCGKRYDRGAIGDNQTSIFRTILSH